jgi:hypothetical protein
VNLNQAALILGILSAVLVLGGCIPCLGPFILMGATVFSIITLVLGAMAHSQADEDDDLTAARVGMGLALLPFVCSATYCLAGLLGAVSNSAGM